MNTPTPPFFRRLSIGWNAFIMALSTPAFAVRLETLQQATSTQPPTQPLQPSAPKPTPAPRLSGDAALQLLELLQREARLVDFTQEDVRAYSDAELGAAARVVHSGCCKVLGDHFTISPVRTEDEGSRIRLEAGFDARAVRLTGNVVGQAPFTGTLMHRGWRASDVRLPQLAAGHDANVLAQAEVEL